MAGRGHVGECTIGVTDFYDGMGNEQLISAWNKAEQWYKTVAEENPLLLSLFEHLKAAHGLNDLSPELGFMFKQHRAAIEMNEFHV